MKKLIEGNKIIILEKRRKSSGMAKIWIEKPGVLLAKSEEKILVQHRNYKESYMINDFIQGLVRIKG